MFTTKKDVDKHVRTGFSKLRTENEKNLRSYSVAKLYAKIGEYTSALHYVSSYLSVKDDSAQAHKLQGQCYESLKKIDKALGAYQRSFQLDPKQSDLLIDVCKLILSDEQSLSQGKFKFWCDLAEAENIQHEALINLKLKLLRRDNANPKHIEDMLLKEILQHPSNIKLRSQLVAHMLDQNRIADAFKYVCDLELKQDEFFSQSLDWYNTVAKVVAKLNSQDLTANWMYWVLSVTTIERQLSLTLLSETSYPQTANITDCANLLFEFDQLLQTAAKCAMLVCPERDLVNQFILHFRGQFCLHAAALVFKRETVQKTYWREVMKDTLPLLLLAYNCGVVNLDEQWCRNSTEFTKNLLRLWNQEGSFRCVQAGRTLLSCVNDSKENTVMANIRKICTENGSWTSNEELLNQIRKFCTDSGWRKEIFRVLFTNSDQMLKQSSSHLIQCAALSEPVYELPRICDLETYEERAQWLHPSSLAHMIYLNINASNIADYNCNVFKGLNFSISNLSNCGAETLNQLDIDSFLYAATIQARQKFDIERAMYESLSNGIQATKPKILPFANIFSGMATEEQSNWWIAAYKVYNNISGEDLAEVRAVLQYGIEAVRGIGGPKMDLMICLRLGQIFVSRSKEANKVAEKGFLESRAETLFKYGLHMMKMQHNRSLDQFRRFFKFTTNNSSKDDRDTNESAQDAVTFLAARYFKNEEYEDCIEEFSNLQVPFATYIQAEAYRKMNESSKTPKKNKRIYMEKAQHYLQQTLTLLEHPSVDNNDDLKSRVLDDMKTIQQHLNKSDNSFSNGNHLVDDYQLNSSFGSIKQNRESSKDITDLAQLMNKMMETLSIVQDEVNGVRTKLTSIEEQLNKKQETSTVDPANALDDYLLIDEELQNQAYNSSYSNYNQPRMHTPNHLMPQMLAAGIGQHPQQQINPYNNSFYNSMYLNPYQTLMAPQRNAMGVVPPQPIQYPDAHLAYNMPHQAASLNDPRNSGAIISLLTQPSQLPTQPPPQVPLQIQHSHLSQPPPTMEKSFNNSNLLRTWNSSYNNAPVEKSPPINVVITNSDPLPQHTSVTSQPTLSVTIPSHHIKNNPIPNETTGQNAFMSGTKPAIGTDTIKFNDVAATEAEKDKVPATNPIMGGISFSSTPIVSPAINNKSAGETTTSKPSPFANFTFGTTSNKTSGKPLTNLFSSFGNSGFSTQTSDKPSNNLFGAFGNSGVSTASPTSNTSGSLLNMLSKTAELPKMNAAKTVESPISAKQPEGAPVHEDEDDYIPTAHFEPVIALPDLVETKTGEEDESIKFEHRSKLLRFVKETKEWKERGIGNMKVLVNKNDPNKVRLLMRREQVFKICCNQFITKDTKFNPLPNNGTSMSWCGQDYSENELQVELLAIRFKTADLCTQFHNAILDAQKHMSDVGKKNATKQEKSTDISKTDKNTMKDNIGFGEKFKLAAGSWNCPSCYLSNKADATMCMACNHSFQKSTNVAEILETTKPQALTTPSANSGFGDMFKPKVGSWECIQCYITNGVDNLYCVACDSPKDDTVPKKNVIASTVTFAPTTKFSFGVPFANTAATVTTTSTPSTNTFSFGTFTAMTTTNTPGANIFGAPPTSSVTLQNSFGFSNNANDQKTVPSSSEPAKLEPKESFSFVFKPKSPSKAKSPLKNVSGTEDISDDENIEEENNTYFTPVIPLPDKIEVKTGEEDEELLYSHRSKLFRFTDSEWKERGLGDVKILRHKLSAKLRVVMRREQILKICLNHALTKDIEYKPKDDKSWHFVANDYSEGEVELLQFCLRFKTPEIAQSFKSAVDDALSGTTLKQDGVVSATKILLSDELKRNCDELSLPLNFYDYNEAVLCKGCRGCNSDTFLFPETKAINLDILDENPIPLVMSVKTHPKRRENVLKQSSFAFGTPIKPMDSSSKIFGNLNTGENLFSQVTFGGTSDPNEQPSIFRNSNIRFNISDKIDRTFPSANTFSFTSTFNSDEAPSFAFGTGLQSKANSINDVKATSEPNKIFSLNTGNTFTEQQQQTSNAVPQAVIFGTKESSLDSKSDGLNLGTQPSIFSGLPIFKPKANTTPSGLTTETIFGTSSAVAPAVANNSVAKFSFLNQSPEKTKESKEEEDNIVPFKDVGLSFADLASKPENSFNLSASNVSEPRADLKSFSSPSSSAQHTFFGLSKTNDFNNFKSMRSPEQTQNGTSNTTNNLSGGEDPNYDPHYDPIIALPDEIVVSTGEEEEEKVFGERAKLYRFDATNREWKERGVGELKILHHTTKGTYRFLLRREQVFKCVLNHMLSDEFEISPMKSSDKAFCWATNNYADNPSGVPEQLSVRFKNSDIAQRFESAVQKCISQLKLEPEAD